MNARGRPYPLFEWCMATIMLGIPLCIVVTPKTIEMGAFRFMLQFLPGPYMVAGFLLVAGLCRIGALVANGRWRYGTVARTAGAWAGAFIWGQMAVALALLTPVTGTLSIGLPAWLVLAAGEIVSAHRVGRDLRLARAAPRRTQAVS